MNPDLMTQTAHGLFVREYTQDRDGVWSVRFYLVRIVEGTASAPVVVLSGPVAFEVRSAPSKVDD